MGLQGAGGVKSFSVRICDGAPSTARSSFLFFFSVQYKINYFSPVKLYTVQTSCYFFQKQNSFSYLHQFLFKLLQDNYAMQRHHTYAFVTNKTKQKCKEWAQNYLFFLKCHYIFFYDEVRGIHLISFS